MTKTKKMSMKANRYILTVDPSIANLGFAITTFDGIVIRFGIVTQHKRQHNYPSRALSISLALRHAVSSFHHPIAHAIVEMPERWVSSRGTKATDSEAVQKLYLTVGSIVLTLRICGCQLWYIEPSRWKGQVPKHLMIRRAKQWLAKQDMVIDKITDHEAEAILLGKFSYEHMQYDRNSLARFQAPIKEIEESNCITRMGPKMEDM